jgi:hypothetical protein
MYLFELDQESVVSSKILALANQIEHEVDAGDIGTNYTVDQLLDYFRQYDVMLDVKDLYNMIKVPPLNTIIKNIQGDKVVFTGQKGDTPNVEPPKGDQKKTVASMAKHALKK